MALKLHTIHYLDPTKQLEGREKKSKLLSPDSELYGALRRFRTRLEERYGSELGEQRMDFHTEVVKRDEEWTAEKLVSRAQELEGKQVNTADPANWMLERKWIALRTPTVSEYGETHVTVAYFPGGRPSGAFSLWEP